MLFSSLLPGFSKIRRLGRFDNDPARQMGLYVNRMLWYRPLCVESRSSRILVRKRVSMCPALLRQDQVFAAASSRRFSS